MDLKKINWYYVALFFIFALGVGLRLKGLLINPSMWHDESALAWNIKFRSYAELFGKLRFMQVAPPIFLVLTKFLVDLFNVQNVVGACDFVMRLVPFTCSILSLAFFYFISKEVLSKKTSLIFSLFLFSINTVLVSYSFEFKQYASDMFFVLLVFLFFLRFKIEQMGYKKLAFTSVFLSIPLWFSFVSGLCLAAGFLNTIFKRPGVKKILTFFSPFLLIGVLYLKFYILRAFVNSGDTMLGYWDDKFINPDLSNFIPLMVENIRYFFTSVNSILFIFILLIWGFCLYIRDKKYDFVTMISLTLIGFVVASMLHLYPFSERLVIFFIPFIILLIAKPLELVCIKRKVISVLVCAMFLFVLIPQIIYGIKTLTFSLNKGEFPREMMGYIAQNIKPDDKIFLNKASNCEFYYYSSFYDLENDVIQENLKEPSEEEYFDYLNSLPKGNYWFFLAYDFSPSRRFINYSKIWAKNNAEIIYYTEATQSTLLYLKID